LTRSNLTKKHDVHKILKKKFVFENIEQIAIQGRAKIEKKKQAEIFVINIKKNESLAKLNIQYQTADKAKKTFGYIGIICLTLLVSVILLNDFAKLCNAIYILWTENGSEPQRETSRRDKEENGEDNENELQIEVDRMYSKDLEMKLKQVHLKLIKAVATNRKN
jgi:hypothetical protein